MTQEEINIWLISVKIGARPNETAFASAVEVFLQDGESKNLYKLPNAYNKAGYELGRMIVTRFTNNSESRALLKFVLLLSEAGKQESGCCVGFSSSLRDANSNDHQNQNSIAELVGYISSDQEIVLLVAKCVLWPYSHLFDFGWVRERLIEFPSGCAADPRYFDEQPRFSTSELGPIEKLVTGLPDEVLENLLLNTIDIGDKGVSARFISYLAVNRPVVFGRWLQTYRLADPSNIRIWRNLVRATEIYDSVLISIIETMDPARRFYPYLVLYGVRGEEFAERTRTSSQAPENKLSGASLSFLADRYPDDVHERLAEILSDTTIYHVHPRFVYEKAFVASAKSWGRGGSVVFHLLTQVPYAPHYGLCSNFYSMALKALANCAIECPKTDLKSWHKEIVAMIGKIPEKRVSSKILEELWETTADLRTTTFIPEMIELLGSKSKTLRDISAKGVSSNFDESVLSELATILSSGTPEEKAGTATCLGMINSPLALKALVAALPAEESDKVRPLIIASIRSLDPDIDLTKLSTSGEPTINDWVERFHHGKRPPDLSKITWLQGAALPSLCGKDGGNFPQELVHRLIEIQAKHKALEGAPDVLPLLTLIDREKSTPFAAALVEGFLNSGQAASDRWALTLGGLLGDKRIIPPLLSRIQDWCENSRHKLAEYAAQAISLLPGNEPLMVLDTLSNRYRSKFKNVGKACAEAFNAAAAARGITTDELGDLVVPDFGFDAEGIRRFDWARGSASAELGADFKLTWFDPDTDKAWKALPANAPEEIKTEVKTLTKLLREAVKGQTARLEMTLVRQRRWPVGRWRELFENHPLLRSFASSLVWGVYDSMGTLLRTFRRYPNGLLADATGALEELPESDTMIGMIHPLELDTGVLGAWRAHLNRFKVKPPFPQVDRPVELLDPLHGNRREVSLTKESKLSAGTFRSRAEKRGWTRGSVIDGGGISSYHKLYPGAGVEVVLPTENFWVGCDPMEAIELRAAYFVKAESVERGSYVYNEPGPEDPRVMRFDAVPAVVWSETISDLKAIVATKE